jgi:hypothetical protein
MKLLVKNDKIYVEKKFTKIGESVFTFNIMFIRCTFSKIFVNHYKTFILNNFNG